MGLFKRSSPRQLLPPNAPALFELLGRYEGPAPGGDINAVLTLSPAVREAFEVDPGRALDEIAAACASVGGWSYYGAWDILSNLDPDFHDDPRYKRIIDGVLDSLQKEGYGPGDTPMSLKAREVERSRADQLPNPETEAEPEISPLNDGERRLLQIVKRPDGNQNKIFLIHRRPSDLEDHMFVAVIQSSEDTDFDFDTEWEWLGGVDERAVYIRVAEAYANSRTATCKYWLESEVEWFADRVG